jgi:hypothetical protein
VLLSAFFTVSYSPVLSFNAFSVSQINHRQNKNNLYLFFIYFWFCEAIGTAATPGLLCQPWVIVKMILEKQMECRLAGETEVLGENLPQRHIYTFYFPFQLLEAFHGYSIEARL